MPPLPPTSPFAQRRLALTRATPLLPLAAVDLFVTLWHLHHLGLLGYGSGLSSPSPPPSPVSVVAGVLFAGIVVQPAPHLRHLPLTAAPIPSPSPSTMPGYGPDIALALLSLLRSGVLGVLSTSVRWRQRSGYLLAACGATLLAVTWEACAGSLHKHAGRRVGRGFLILTAGLAVFEYLYYLLLVRLVPPSSFTLRAPPGRSPTFPLSPSITPLPGRNAQPLFFTPQTGPLAEPLVGSYASYASDWRPYRQPNAQEEGDMSALSLRSREHDAYDAELGYGSEYDDHEHGHETCESECSECSLCSSVSESSIIDLPRPRPPAPIVVESNSIADFAAAASGGVVRRSGSARALGASWESEGGYGTFAR